MITTIALRNLWQARRRTLLLGVALGLVMALLVLLMSLSAGMSETMMGSATTLATGHVNVGGFFKAKSSDASPIITGVSTIRADVAEAVPNAELIIDRARGWARVVSPEGSMKVGLTGIDLKEELRLLETLQLAPEAQYLEQGAQTAKGQLSTLDSKAGHGIILFAAQAERLKLRVGDPITIVAETMQGQRNSQEVTLTAVVKDIGFLSNFSVFVSKSTIRKLYRLGGDVSGVVQVYLKDYQQAGKVMGEIRAHLEKKGHEMMPYDPLPFFAKFSIVSGEAWTGQKLDLTSWSDEISFLRWILKAVGTVSWTLITTLLVIIGIGIMNSMWISVRERTNEVGTLRAIGMSRPRILLMFVLEAVLLGLFATAAGGIAGALACWAIDYAEVPITVDAVRAILMSEKLHLVVKLGDILQAMVGFTVVCGLSSLWPAIRAARLQPVTAIHHVG